MKSIYWRPRGVSRTALLLIAALALAGLVSVEVFQTKQVQPYLEEKIEAANLARAAMNVLKEERLKRKLPVDKDADPLESGLIGTLMSPVTSNRGSLSAKQTSVNPNFSAVVVHLLKRAGVEEGDAVAVGLSGSFPAINISVYAAIETLGLKGIVISSASASSWGANIPKLLWIDMERTLFDRRVFSLRSAATSVGGVEDRGLGMEEEGLRLLKKTIDRSKLPFLDPADYAESIERRMALYRELAGTETIKAYINVGGGTTSVGTKIGKQMFKPGLNRRMPVGGPYMDSVMSRMIEAEVPVIHLVKIETLAMRYGLPIQPTRLPVVGEGKIFYRMEYNPYLAAGVLVTILAILYLFVRSEWGFRILFSARRLKRGKHPEPMI